MRKCVAHWLLFCKSPSWESLVCCLLLRLTSVTITGKRKQTENNWRTNKHGIWRRGNFYMALFILKFIHTAQLTEQKSFVITAKFNYLPTRVRAVSNTTWIRGPGLRQTMLDAACGRSIDKTRQEKLTNALAKWIATACWPISVVEDFRSEKHSQDRKKWR